MLLSTPYYLIDETKLLKNLEKIKYVKDRSGAKAVLALKCFSAWAVFDLMRKYLDGTTGSSVYEARLGHEKFGGEVHAYSAAFSPEDIQEVILYAGKIIFNSLTQLKTFHSKIGRAQAGLRLNPQVSYSRFDLADPARKYSRLGVTDYAAVLETADLINGVMFHYNCENNDFDNFSSLLDKISRTYTELLERLNWVSLGGGIYFTREGYPRDKFADKLKEFSQRFNVQIYLEPGEAAVTGAAYLATKILDIVHNEIDIAIVDSSTEAHMLDLLVYRENATIENCLLQDGYRYMIAGKSCLAGDIFGTFNFKSKLNAGDTIHIADAAGYTMVKKNWFNGLKMPAIAVKRLNGACELIKTFGYKDFKNALS